MDNPRASWAEVPQHQSPLRDEALGQSHGLVPATRTAAMYGDKVFSRKIDQRRLDKFTKFIWPFIICNALYPLGFVNGAPKDSYFVIFESW